MLVEENIFKPLGDDELREVALSHNLSPEEIEKIKEILGRNPNLLEVGVFSALWSEHCSYKSSKLYLAKLPKNGERVLASEGENAGVLDVGNGMVIAFKMESHNHPSAVEPFQGAATGVGGIIRDVLALGLRPIALADPLRFGDTPHLIEGVIEGIAWYGNSIGVPTVAGEFDIDPMYEKNPLVNVMAVAYGSASSLISSKPRLKEGKDRLLAIYVGNRTGRDGIHGASFASAKLGDEDKRPAVQIGDPFTEKLLIEFMLEVASKGLVEACQDMGAAGLLSSSFEMALKGGLSLKLDLDKVPLREEGMNPYEILLSESQERMLLAVSEDKLRLVELIARKWDLEYSVVGEFFKSDGEPVAHVLWGNKEVATFPLKYFDGEGPRYSRPVKSYSPPPYKEPNLVEPQTALQKLLSHPRVASKKWIYTRYDWGVGGNTIRHGDGADAAIIRLEGADYYLAITTDGDGVKTYLDPKAGMLSILAEVAMNLYCSAADPIGITDNLNFGNPENPEVMWQFKVVVGTLARAAKLLNVPVVSGNVSFYNEYQGERGMVEIYPTPVLGVVGLVKVLPPGVSLEEGDVVYLLGWHNPSFSGSLYQRIFGEVSGKPPRVKLGRVVKTGRLIKSLIEEGYLTAAHDVSDGGIMIALAEMLLKNELGFQSEVPGDHLFWFGESPGVALVGVRDEDSFLQRMKKEKVPYMRLGRVLGDEIEISGFLRILTSELGKYYRWSSP